MLTIEIPQVWKNRLLQELKAAGRREIGGILMGEQLQPNQFRLADMTFQRRGGHFARFVRQARRALVALQQFFNKTAHQYRQFNYLGEWHSHPQFAPIPSTRDHETMLNIACRGNTGANFVVLMIVRLTDVGELDGSLSVYLPDGRVDRGHLTTDSAPAASDQARN